MTQSKIYELADQHEHDEWTDTYTHECTTPGEYEPCYSCETCGYALCEDCGEFKMDTE